MEWRKWCKEDLPEPNQKVLLWYKSGYHGAIEFFLSKEGKEMYIKGMEWYEQHPEPCYDGKIQALKVAELMSLTDPITFWMTFPEGPK